MRTLKKQFIADLCTVDPRFPFYLWERLLPQVTMTLNMLQQSQLNPGLSDYEQVDGIQNFELIALSSLGCKLKIHEKIISDSPTIPTQSMYGTLDHQSIIIYVKFDITLILEGKLHQIQ